MFAVGSVPGGEDASCCIAHSSCPVSNTVVTVADFAQVGPGRVIFNGTSWLDIVVTEFKLDQHLFNQAKSLHARL